MKNNISYYYSLKPKEIIKDNHGYHFSINELNYDLIEYLYDERNLKNAIQMMDVLSDYGIYSNKIITNNFKSYLSNIDNHSYILIASRIDLDKEININDVEMFKRYYFPYQKFYKEDWNILWTVKMDYYNYQVNHFKNSYPLLEESFAYYSGYIETGIELLNDYIDKSKNQELSISHKRISKNDSLYNLYDPMNIIVDSNMRDICEYFKLLIFEDNKTSEKIIDYLSVNNFKNSELQRFFVRMLYPTFYFDKFEEIINNQLKESEIEYIVKNSYKYEAVVKKLYRYLYSLEVLPFIDWLSY